MVDDQFNLNLLRGWQRNQLEILKVFAYNQIVPQTKLSIASGATVSSSALGGKITPLIRHDLIVKAYKDNDGKYVWQLNEEKVNKEKLQDFLKKIGI